MSIFANVTICDKKFLRLGKTVDESYLCPVIENVTNIFLVPKNL